MIAEATTKRAQPGKLMPKCRRSRHAVIGHAAQPENKANQPLVGGHGPKVMMSPSPPMMVSNAQPQATIHPRMRRNGRMRCGWPVAEALIYMMMRCSYGSDSKTTEKISVWSAFVGVRRCVEYARGASFHSAVSDAAVPLAVADRWRRVVFRRPRWK